MKNTIASLLLFTGALTTAVGCATENRIVTGHGYGVGSALGARSAELDATEAATLMTTPVAFELELLEKGHSIRMLMPASKPEDVRVEQVDKLAFRAEVDLLLTPEAESRRAALGEPTTVEVELAKHSRKMKSGRNAAIAKLVKAMNTCPDDVRTLSGRVEVVEMDVFEAEGVEKMRMAAHVNLDACGAPSRLPKKKLPPAVQKGM